MSTGRFADARGLENFARRFIAERLVQARVVGERQPRADVGLRVSDGCVSLQINLFVFQTAPKPFDEDVVESAPLAVE